MWLILTILLIFVFLVASELWWRKRDRHNEFSRKFIHIFVGSLVAFAPFYLSWIEIIILSAGFIVTIAVSKYFNIFQSIHAVERPTWGEIYFALAVGALAFVTHQPWIYAAALLHMSLADGLAAVTGVTWGQRTMYKVFGHSKSVVGSATFFLVSVAILAWYQHAVGDIGVPAIVGLAAATTVIENIGVQGLDNLFVPLLVGAVLTILR